MAAYILKTYRIQSDENIRNYVYPPDPEVVRDEAKFLEQNTLNVFSERVIDPAALVLIPSEPLNAIDALNGKALTQENVPIVIDQKKQPTVTISGWAVDRQANAVASAVFVRIDERTDIPALYGLDRPDVAKAHFGNTNFRFSGYLATFSSSVFTKGEHDMSLKIVSKDGAHYYSVGRVLHVIVN